MKSNLLLCNTCILLFLFTKVHSQTFTSSNLPIVVIDTYGQYIDTAYQEFIVGMGIIDNGAGNRNYLTDPFNDYNGEVEINIRGSSSLWLPKKQYTINTLDANHQKVKASILGMPEEDAWVMGAPYQDKTLIRDQLTYRVYTQMGHYSSRSKFFELVINGDYRGVYEMKEKIKRDDYRVDIAKLTDTDLYGEDVTGGYIIKLDKYLPGEEGWYSNYNSNVTHDSANYFLYDYPKAIDMPIEQKNYIKNYFHKFEEVLVSNYYTNPDSGYSKYINVESFIDNLIINELARNVDGYRSSSYFFKDKISRGDGKLHCGPVWDFNIAWGNCFYNGGNNPAGWQYQQFANNNFVPFWWWQVMSDPAFKFQLKCRYQYLRTNVLTEAKLYQYIDSIANQLEEAQIRNFTRWPIMGQVVTPNPSPVPTSYAGEISSLKSWIQQRMEWLDVNMPGFCVADNNEVSQSENTMATFPNPFANSINASYYLKENTKLKIELLDMIGDEVMVIFDGNKNAGMHQAEINTGHLAAGTYIMQLKTDNLTLHQKLIKIE